VGAGSRFGLQIGMIPRSERSFGTHTERNWWFGQLATAGVDLATLDLIGVADTPRLWEDASA
jgi:hypothetical protein